MSLPKIAITMGDPAGIGPEIIVGAYNSGLSNLECIPVIIGNAKFLHKAINLKKADIEVVVIKDISQSSNNQIESKIQNAKNYVLEGNLSDAVFILKNLESQKGRPFDIWIKQSEDIVELERLLNNLDQAILNILVSK